MSVVVLPMLVPFGVGRGAVARAGVGLGTLAAIWGAVQAAVILGAAGLVRRPRERVLAASGD